MIPRILEYENGHIKITPEAYMLPETNAIIKKYGDMDCEPYLGYVYMMAYPDTPYNYMSKSERSEAALFDVKESIGDFDENCDLLQNAIDRLESLWKSAQTEAADELEEELRRWVKYLKDTPTGGEEMENRFKITDKFEKLSLSAANLRKLADEEIRTKMKGANELGEY
jgi:Rad3-related DNA helicase